MKYICKKAHAVTNTVNMFLILVGVHSKTAMDQGVEAYVSTIKDYQDRAQGTILILRQWHVENAMIFVKYAGFLFW